MLFFVEVIDILFLGLYIVCQLMSLALPVWGLVRFELRPISSFFVTAEQVGLFFALTVLIQYIQF